MGNFAIVIKSAIHSITFTMKKEILLSLALIGALTGCAQQHEGEATPSRVQVTVPSVAPATQEDFINAAESTVNGVVSVKSFADVNELRRQQQQSDPLFEFFFGSPRQQQAPHKTEPQYRQVGLGSGVIISPAGYIVTNNHVIDGARHLEVTLNDNRNFEAEVIGTDPTTDLALIKIDAQDLHVIPMGNSEDLRLGEWVLAVGNPFGFTSTVTSGIVSAKARNISTTVGARASNGIESFIQTDAAVNSGNSGGALVNLKGELVGINTAIYSSTGTYAGYSFAIPTSIVSKVITDLQSYGEVQRAYLGIAFGELTPELIAAEKIEGVTSGIYVGRVESRSAAAEAGINEGDVIVAIAGKPTRSTAELQETITRLNPGDEVDVELFRNGKKMTVRVTLRNNHGTAEINPARSSAKNPLGATFESVDAETAKKFGLRNGIKVTNVVDGGRFAEAGIKDGLVILSVNGVRITSPEMMNPLYKEIMNSGSNTEKVMFVTGFYPSTGKNAYFAVDLSN